MRDECLNVHQFTSLDHAKAVIEAWRIDYNDHRPHSALVHLAPSEFRRSGQIHGVESAAALEHRCVSLREHRHHTHPEATQRYAHAADDEPKAVPSLPI